MTEFQAFSKRCLHVPRPFLNNGERILAVLLTLLVYLHTIIFLALFIFLWGGGCFHFGQPLLLAVLFQVSCVCYARLEHRILPDRERLARCATLLLVFLTDRLRLRLWSLLRSCFGVAQGSMVNGLAYVCVFVVFTAVFAILRLAYWLSAVIRKRLKLEKRQLTKMLFLR